MLNPEQYNTQWQSYLSRAEAAHARIERWNRFAQQAQWLPFIQPYAPYMMPPLPAPGQPVQDWAPLDLTEWSVREGKPQVGASALFGAFGLLHDRQRIPGSRFEVQVRVRMRQDLGGVNGFMQLVLGIGTENQIHGFQFQSLLRQPTTQLSKIYTFDGEPLCIR